MKIEKLILTTSAIITILALKTVPAVAQCDYLDEGDNCGAPPQYAACSNDCEDIGYSVNGPSETCAAISEYGCGMDGCNTSKVTIWVTYGFATEMISNGQCYGCNSTDETWWPPIDDGTCEQDSIPSGASQCGTCGD